MEYKKMDFGKYLECCIRKRGLSINALSKECDINRGGLYSVFKKQRKLKEDKLFLLIEKINLSAPEEEKLIELYFKEVYGCEEFKKIEYIIYAIDSLQLPGQPNKSKNKHAGHGRMMKQTDITDMMALFINENQNIISNFPFTYTDIDNLFYQAVCNREISSFSHILALEESGDFQFNYTALFSSLKYLYRGCFPFYYWTNLDYIKRNVAFPYFALGDKNAILFCRSCGIKIDDTKSLSVLKETAERLLKNCRRFGKKFDDVMQVKDVYQKSFSKRGLAISIKSYPCIAPFLDNGMMSKMARDDIENKEMLVNIALEHYNGIYSSIDFLEFVTEQGIKDFAQTGNVSEISNKYVKNLDIKSRIKILGKIKEAVECGSLYIIDRQKMNVPKGFSIEKHMGRVFFQGWDYQMPDFSQYDLFIASINDISLASAIEKAADYMIKSQIVCDKKYSLRFIDGIISALEFLC